ncbi:MAG: CRISPR system precrRNA processing endoribonuclease RAMP protein Cas6 [Chloroflexi bacterium]|nr:CRISPR system precrRNA processing endoribonuclease RAMP protein Cas6 [Chloroflexota bacterium]
MIPIVQLEFVMHSEYPLDLGANPGSSLRGALYETLAVMYDTGDPVRSRHDTETNLVAWLLRLEDAEKTGGKDAPRPVTLRPPQRGSEDEQAFTLALYGRAIAAAGLLVSAVAAMGQIGVGRERKHHKFKLGEVRATDPLTRQTTVILDAHGEQIAALPTPPSAETYANFAQMLATEQVTLRFITPTRIVDHGALCRQPAFRPLFQRLIERIRQISDLYAEPVWVPFRDLLEVAEAVRLTSDRTRWQELWSHSRIEGMSKPMSGYVGEAVYAGDLTALLPYLLVGQALQVGKNAIKGAGWFEVVYRWR